MTQSITSVRTAVAAAIAAAAVLAAVAAPAQAEYKRAPHAKRKITKMKRYHVLKCLASKGDVVAEPLVINTSGKIIPIGGKIQWRATMANGSIQTGIYTLTAPLYAGQSRRIPKPLHWKFTCRASVFV
jgi:uncharacterized membrane protein